MPGDLSQAQQVGTQPDSGNKGTTFTERVVHSAIGGVGWSDSRETSKKFILPVIFSTRICC